MQSLQSSSLGSTTTVLLALAGTGAFAAGGSSGTGVPALPPPQNLRIEVESFVSGGNHIVFRSREYVQNGDLTGDGDEFDWPAFHYDVRSQRLVQLWPEDSMLHVRELAGAIRGLLGSSEQFLAYQVEESPADLNHDGDAADEVAMLYRFATGVTYNLGVSAPSVALAADYLMLGVFERDQGDADMNANGSDIDSIAHVLGLTRRTPFGH